MKQYFDDSNTKLDSQIIEFQCLDMLNLDKINQKFSVIFFIASFHHLENIGDRLKVLENAYNLLEND
jgi:hypothetical protein